MISDDLLDVARRLAEGNPSQTDLRRATSSVYYALFHAIAQSNADTLVGDAPLARDPDAWRQAYRALDHGYARRRCEQARSDARFSTPIQSLAGHFVLLQTRRHRADYDPDATFSQPDVLDTITQIDETIAAFRNAPARERRAFAVFVLMRERQE